MAEIDLRSTDAATAYKLLLGAVQPRPIAWVSTLNASGQSNIAPFSFFTAVCSAPPTVIFCPAVHPNGREKDTLNNITATKQFVVNMVSEELAAVMNETSADLPADQSEFEVCGLESAPSKLVKPPRVKLAPVSLECELSQIVPIGKHDGTPASVGAGSIVIGRVLYVHVRDDAYEDGKIITAKARPISRLAGFTYAPVREIFEMLRPVSKQR